MTAQLSDQDGLTIRGITVRVPPNCEFIKINCGTILLRLPDCRAYYLGDDTEMDSIIAAVARHAWLEEAKQLKSKAVAQVGLADWDPADTGLDHLSEPINDAIYEAEQWARLARGEGVG